MNIYRKIKMKYCDSRTLRESIRRRKKSFETKLLNLNLRKVPKNSCVSQPKNRSKLDHGDLRD